MHQEERQSPEREGMLRSFSAGLTWVQREKKALGKGRGQVTCTGCYKEQLQATSIKNPKTNRKNIVDDYLKPKKISISNKCHGKKPKKWMLASSSTPAYMYVCICGSVHSVQPTHVSRW